MPSEEPREAKDSPTGREIYIPNRESRTEKARLEWIRCFCGAEATVFLGPTAFCSSCNQDYLEMFGESYNCNLIYKGEEDEGQIVRS